MCVQLCVCSKPSLEMSTFHVCGFSHDYAQYKCVMNVPVCLIAMCASQCCFLHLRADSAGSLSWLPGDTERSMLRDNQEEWSLLACKSFQSTNGSVCMGVRVCVCVWLRAFVMCI